ncbi:hypothetical protein O3G_MSEX013423 [Manduca sexta]|uniref:Uncharacterized protein n=1 Tax=Manduca sexta TaxID=7130 RepID=A0A922CY53_MANSE|nr:hypothetical protein O3G_MSEX013423 [Manduca sexta]
MSRSGYLPQTEPVTEDTVQCFFFFTSLPETDTCWQQRCSDMNNTIKKISKNYIWHRDEFNIYQPISNTTVNDIPQHLASYTCFGDNVEDEWFIVYIILQLTKQYDDLIVQVRDNDGEFLLIEAANLLPSWANPENTDNRETIIANIAPKLNSVHLPKWMWSDCFPLIKIF